MNVLKISIRSMVFLLAFSTMGCELPISSEEPEVPVIHEAKIPTEELIVEEPATVPVVGEPVEEAMEGENLVDELVDEAAVATVLENIENLDAEELSVLPEIPSIDDSAVMDALDAAIEERLQYARDEKGFNVVSEEGVVLNEEGEEARTDVEPLSEEAPQQSNPLDANAIPENSITLEVSKAAGYVPNEFEVKAGQAITLVIKSVDEKVHIFRFQEDELSAVAVGVAGMETRAIKFNAPQSPGEYVYFSDVPGQKNKIGKMIVK